MGGGNVVGRVVVDCVVSLVVGGGAVVEGGVVVGDGTVVVGREVVRLVVVEGVVVAGVAEVVRGNVVVVGGPGVVIKGPHPSRRLPKTPISFGTYLIPYPLVCTASSGSTHLEVPLKFGPS